MNNMDVSLAGEFGKEINRVAIEMGQYACQTMACHTLACQTVTRHCVEMANTMELVVAGNMKALNLETVQKAEALKVMQEVIDSNVESSQSIGNLQELFQF